MKKFPGIAGIAALLAVGAGASWAQSPEQLQAVEAALPAKPTVAPQKPRKVLVFSLCQGAVHEIVGLAEKTIVLMGKKTGAFETVTSNNMDVFEPATLAAFDAILFNNTTQLKFEKPEHRRALMAYVEGGKGVIGIHAATDNFYDYFPEASAMMGGIFDGHPWTAEGTWAVKLDDRNHPVNKGFGGKNFSINDEIYQFRGPYSRTTHRVLLSLDMARPENARDGQHRADKDNPIAWIKRHGQGRVFYSALGHNPSVYWNPSVLQHYLDGIQYALGDLKADDTPSAVAKNLVPGDPEPLVSPALAGYQITDDPSGFRAIAERMRGADAALMKQMEVELLAFIQNPKATKAAVEQAVRLLRGCAGEASVPVLSPLLQDKDLSHIARWTLQGIPSPKVDAALLNALDRVPAELQAGMLSSLAARRTASAVPAAAHLLTSSAPNLAEAAVFTLGRLGTVDAEQALRKAQADDRLRPLVLDARLACAEALHAAGQSEKAVEIYKHVLAASAGSPAAVAALYGLLRVDPPSGVTALLTAMAGGNPALRMAAAAAIARLPEGAEITQGVAGPLKTAAPEVQAVALVALAQRADRSALPAILPYAEAQSAQVRIAALEAMALFGDVSTIPILFKGLGQEETSDAAVQALLTMPGDGVGGALVAAFEASTDAAFRVKLAEILSGRREKSAVPALMKAWPQAEKTLQAAALKAIGEMGSEQDVPALAEALATVEAPALRRVLGKAAQDIALREPGPAARHLAAGMKKASGKNREELIQLLGNLGGKDALEAIRGELASDQADIRKTAVRILAAWKSNEPLNDLRAAAQSEKDAVTQLLALRGFIAMTVASANLPAEVRAAHLKDAFAMATRPDEKKTILAALAAIPGPASIALAKEARNDPALVADANQVLLQIDGTWLKELLKTMTLSASANGGEAKNALDGDMNTRWNTGRGMGEGDWFQIDLGEEKKIGGLTVDAGSSKLDYPRGLDVLTSKDGAQWTKSFSLAANQEPVVTATFATPVDTRYIKLVQTGKGDGGLHWSIHEIRLAILN